MAESGLVFVGPSPESIESFGLKHTARKLAEQAGVPTVPGSQDLLQNEEKAVQAARGLGFPVSPTRPLDLHRNLVFNALILATNAQIHPTGHAESHGRGWWNGPSRLCRRR